MKNLARLLAFSCALTCLVVPSSAQTAVFEIEPSLAARIELSPPGFGNALGSLTESAPPVDPATHLYEWVNNAASALNIDPLSYSFSQIGGQQSEPQAFEILA